MRLEAFTRCGDLSFGFPRLRCISLQCSKKGELLLAYSCKVRGLCLSCEQRRAIEWVERMVEEPGEAGHQRSWSASRAGPGGSREARDRRVPRVPYRQIVFTIPRRLRKHFLFDCSLYGKFCRAARRSHFSLTRPALASTIRPVRALRAGRAETACAPGAATSTAPVRSPALPGSSCLEFCDMECPCRPALSSFSSGTKFSVTFPQDFRK